MSSKILGILGSPRKDGNTADLLEAALSGARSSGATTERLDLADMNLNPCKECRACDAGATCAFADDDDMGQIYSRIRNVDGIVLASPIFFMGVSAQTKAMVDRCQSYWVERYVLERRAYEGKIRPKGLFVSCAGSPKPNIFEPALHVVKAFFAAIDYQYVGEVLLGHTDDPAMGPRKQTALVSAEAAGRRLVPESPFSE